MLIAWWYDHCPWMQFYLQSAVVEKGIKIKNYMHARMDVILGCFITDIVAFAIILACAATIYVSGTGRSRMRAMQLSHWLRWQVRPPASFSP